MLTLVGCSSYYPRHHTRPNEQQSALEVELHSYVDKLSTDIGERNCWKAESLTRTVEWIESELIHAGYSPQRQVVDVSRGELGCSTDTVYNIIAELSGGARPDEILLIGAHYDSKAATPGWHDHGPRVVGAPGTPGANDNGSGVAALLSIAKALAQQPSARTVRFVFFANEEPPFFQHRTEMGSWVYAQQVRMKGETLVGAIVFDAVGTYSPQPLTKRKRYGFLPTLIGLPERSDYVTFLGNAKSRSFIKKCAKSFQRKSAIDLRTVAFPDVVKAVAWSDDWAFWQEGYPAFTITDSAFLRADHYHELTDRPENLDYQEFAAVVAGVTHLVKEIQNT